MWKPDMNFSGNIVDVVNGRVFKGTISINEGRISSVREEDVAEEVYILPGLIDAHIHIESSMMVPSEFARLAVIHGTVGTVSDPHEIANVLGVKGVQFMIANGKQVPFHFCFGVPSCVPATSFETSGARLGLQDTEALLASGDTGYLSEMMNFPGVINQDEEVMGKLALARKYGKPVDGHAPGLTGLAAEKYIKAGISTDHECYTMKEACDKIGLGMKILIREGSAARNFETLAGLINSNPEMVMLCSDDKHPDDLLNGHINQLVQRAFSKGIDKIKVLKAATLNPVRHYNLGCGLLQKGDSADFIIVDNLVNFGILETWIRGTQVAKMGKSFIGKVHVDKVNNFRAGKIHASELSVTTEGTKLRVIQTFDGQLVTGELFKDIHPGESEALSDKSMDILKLVVVNRYTSAPPALAFVKGFGLRSGAIAASIAHDSHNIIATGVDDDSICKAINAVIEAKGGIAVVTGMQRKGPENLRDDKDLYVMPLPVAGIMSDSDGSDIARTYKELNERVKTDLGSGLRSPFMTLSFMALLVIPELKLSDKGLFDGRSFSFVSLFEK